MAASAEIMPALALLPRRRRAAALARDAVVVDLSARLFSSEVCHILPFWYEPCGINGNGIVSMVKFLYLSTFG